MGLVECVLWLMTNADDVDFRWPCPQHLSGDGILMHHLYIDSKEIRDCQGCQRMLNSAVRATYERSHDRTNYKYGSSDYYTQSVTLMKGCMLLLEICAC